MDYEFRAARQNRIESKVGIRRGLGGAEMLNEWSRRGFFGSVAVLPFMGKTTSITRLWDIVGAPPPVRVEEAATFIRQFNTVQAVLYQQNGKSATRDEVFCELIKHREHVRPGNLWSRFTPMADEILPGWTLDFAVVPGESQLMSAEQEDGSTKPLADGYRLILKGEQYTLITDEGVVIYKANTPEALPTAPSLSSAAEFPGAKPLY